MAGIFIGWNFHMFYIALEPKNITSPQKIESESKPKTIIKFVQSNMVQKSITEKKVVQNIDSNISNKSKFEKLLKSGNFDDAMAFYLEADEKELKSYKLILKVYFYDNATKNPQKIIDEILRYIELEPNSQDIKIYLAKLYRDKKEFQKALDLLFELRDTQNSKIVENDLNLTIDSYINHLKTAKEYSKLIAFLEDIINRVEDSQSYIIRLAQLYNELDNYEESKKLLEDIDEGSVYISKAQSILKDIEKKEKELQHYKYIIPINKVGSQYSVNLTINNTPLTLLLDTGATYTFIDEEKLPSLVLGKEILLNTAGGEIMAHFANVDSLTIGELQLNDFIITLAPFKQQFADGLLGMNFFEKFDFKINQNIGLLYLADKE